MSDVNLVIYKSGFWTDKVVGIRKVGEGASLGAIGHANTSRKEEIDEKLVRLAQTDRKPSLIVEDYASYAQSLYQADKLDLSQLAAGTRVRIDNREVIVRYADSGIGEPVQFTR